MAPPGTDNLSGSGRPLYIVSGLPRSGTSMMMQMLAAGGVPLFTDGARVADENNPRGYAEHDRVKGLARDAAWLPAAQGHAIKIVAPLLLSIPPGLRCQVLFLNRDLDEVLASQTKMLQRLNQAGPPGAADRLATLLGQQVARAKTHVTALAGVELLEIEHRRAIASPREVADAVADFLRFDGFDPGAAASAVDPTLHRERKGSRPPVFEA